MCAISPDGYPWRVTKRSHSPGRNVLDLPDNILIQHLFIMSTYINNTMNKRVKHYQIGNATDAGKVRNMNEDYYGTRETRNGEVVIVCDGMGGHAGGETASRLAVDSIISSLNEKVDTDPINALNEALLYANKVILDYAREHPELKGMGSTCVALLLKDDCFYYAHVGDSRIYLFSGNHLQQLTKDHSLVQSLVDAKAISAKDAEHHPRKNEITNALGLERMLPPSLCQKPVRPQNGDMVLLCTDGLTGMVSDQKIQDVLCSSSDLYEKAKELVLLANNAGGSDNITLQLVKFTGSMNPGVSESEGKKGSKKVLLFAGVIMILFLLGGLAVMASCGFSGSTLAQKIATFFRHESYQPSLIKEKPQGTPVLSSKGASGEIVKLQSALAQAQRDLDSARAEVRREHDKSDSLNVALLTMTKERDAALLLVKKYADAPKTPLASGSSLTIGKQYNGGIIVDLDRKGQHGLLAATSDMPGHSKGMNKGYFTWSDAKTLSNRMATGDSYRWRLPTKVELNTLYLKKGVVGVFNDYYWSSTENKGSVWVKNFRNGNFYPNAKTMHNRVRAVKDF